MATYGQVGWDDNNSKFDKEKFLKLEEGMTTVRMLMEKPYKYLYHKVKFPNDKNNYGRNVRCATDNCPLCAEKDQQQSKYIVAVCVKKAGQPGQFKYLEFGPGLYNNINTLRKNIPGCADVMEYDLNIIKNSNGGPANFYTAVPGQKSALSADEIEMIDSKIDSEWLENYVKPISPTDVNKTIERISNWLDKSKAKDDEAAAKNTAQARGKKGAAVVAAPESDEEEKPVTNESFTFKVMKK